MDQTALDYTTLGRSDLRVSKICLGTMTFGEQVGEAEAHAILDHALARGVNFLDTAELYSIPPKRNTYGATETIIGHWLKKRPEVRKQVVIATKVAGPSRGMDWIRGGSANLSAADIVRACDDSLRRLHTDVIDLYQIHWPARNVPAFGGIYFDPAQERPCNSIHEQLEGLATLVRAGKVRHVGLSNETPWGVSEFVRVAESHGLPRIVSVQNPYCLVNRVVDNGLDEVMFREQVSLLAYSPLAFGTLTGKYDQSGIDPQQPDVGRLARFDSMRRQRWARPEVLVAAQHYNALAREHGLTPTQLALAFCYQSWRVASTIIGVTSLTQLDEDIDAWRTTLPATLVAGVDKIRWKLRDPAQ
jgi:aryl-alcohol dehydrogenase-like predicted oxidoreductase